MALILYTLTALALLFIAHRFVTPISKYAALVLFVIPFAIAGHALLANRVLAPIDLPYQTVPLNWMKEQYGINQTSSGIHGDVYSQFIPWRKAVQDSFARGEWGLWNRFTLNGDVLLASEQPAVYSPVTLLACLLPTALSFTFTGALTLLIAGLTVFLFARELGCREGAALVAAAGRALGSSIVFFLHVSIGVTWAWAPLVFLGVRRVVRRREPSILAFALTMLLVGGHSESALLVVVLGIAYGLFELAQHRAHALRPILLAFAAGAIALALNAIHLLPFYDALPHTMEYVHRDQIFRDAPGGIPTPHVLGRIATTFFPYLHGRGWKFAELAPPAYVTGAVGSILVGLAIYAIWRVRSRESWFLGAMLLLALLAGAEWKPLATILAKIPLMDIALQDRFVLAASLAMTILSALAAEEICRRGGDRAAAVTLLAWLAIVIAGNAFFLHSPWIDHHDVHFGAHVVLAEIALLVLAVAILLQRRALIPLLLGAIVAQRALSIGDSQKSFASRAAYPPIPMLGPLRKIETPFRIVGHGNAFLPATSTLYELEDPRGYSAMTLLRYRETAPLWSVWQHVWFNRVDDLTRPFLSFLNVRYAITWDRDPPPDGWREVSRQRGSMLLENMRVLDRAFVPGTVHVGGRADLVTMQRLTDFRERAWIETPYAPYERTNGPGTVAIRNARLGYLIDANMQGDGWIVTSISAWPGWRAYVDGKRLQMQTANHAFLSIHVPQGRHRVVLKYWPRGFVIGRAITFATLLTFVICGIWISSLHRRRS